ncbi:MAG: DUF4157 domain-containing protein [Cellulomonas sp.]|uniref:eCIS core domain-containing protein n=1 Tax=Cellulomonas sp. TaxID=40001 RepID=UPI001A00E320|nr:DUF4157 domain-containing protein [Cellulomonas sp.]MBF0686754.1 DUF4157 domain-containing protein [Cellulomonas sp.]
MTHARPVPEPRRPAQPRPSAPVGLGERWAAAAREPARALPGRADLERRFGASLSAVRVFDGTVARSLLHALGARAAASGSTVLLGPGADAQTVAHEVAHVVQAGAGSAGGPAVLSTPAPIAADHPAEREAEQAAHATGLVRLRARLSPGALALRRAVLPLPDPEVATEPQPWGVVGAAETARAEDLVAPPEADPDVSTSRATSAGEAPAAEQSDAQGTEEGRPGEAAETAPGSPGEPSASADGPEAAPASSGESSASADGPAEPAEDDGRTPAVDRGRTGPAGGRATAARSGRDRRERLAQVVARAQATWDGAAATAGGHEIRPCADVVPTQRTPVAADRAASPPARGPPSGTARPTPVPDVPAPRAPEPDTTAVARAREAARAQVGTAPARAPPPDTAGLSADEQRERAGHQRQLEQRITSTESPATTASAPETRGGPGADAPPTPDGTVPSASAAMYRERAAAAQQQHRTATDEGFGERRLEPERDPTAGLDLRLESLPVPTVDVVGAVDPARLDRVATPANAGAVPLHEVVLVQDGPLAAVEQSVPSDPDARAQVAQRLDAADTQVRDACVAAGRDRDRLRDGATAGVQQRRTAWQGEGETLLAQREQGVDELTTRAAADADRTERDGLARAARITTDAQAEGDRQWEDARGRARTRVAATADRGWFQRGLDWVREQVGRLVAWVDSFLAACRRAITALLDAAARLAHAVVEAARQAVATTFRLLHAAVDVLAANLPGELGELAQRYRTSIHTFLDGVQGEIDAWAAGLHRSIDAVVADVTTAVTGLLDEVGAGVRAVGAAVDDLLANGLMAFLRARFPLLASLLDEGLAGPVDRTAAALDGWVERAMEATGLAALDAMLADLEVESMCAARPEASPEQQALDCAAFQQSLQDAMGFVDRVLASPMAVQLQQFLQRQAAEGVEDQINGLSDFFAVVRWVAAPVYQWWQDIQPAVSEVLDDLGEIGATAWLHIATALGIDPAIGPVEALRQGINALWQAITDAARPVLDALRAAWRWLRDSSPLAPFLQALGRLPEVWAALGKLWDQVSQGAADWFAAAAQTLSRTVLPIVDAVLGAASSVLVVAVGAIDAWGSAVLGVVSSVLAWRPGLALLDAVVAALERVTSPLRRLLAAFRACAVATLRYLAVELRHLRAHVRMLLDVAVGLVFALLTFPIGVVAFLAGNLWLYVLPECYKAPLLNFLLEVAIRFVSFIPEPADLGLAIAHQGLLHFLIGLRAAPNPQKIGAVNLLASLYAGNAMFAAGFAVGIVEGLWAATGGTVVFLLQAALWLATLPFRVMAWGAGMLSGALQPEPDGAEPAAADAEPAAAEVGPREAIRRGATAPSVGRRVARAAREPRALRRRVAPAVQAEYDADAADVPEDPVDGVWVPGVDADPVLEIDDTAQLDLTPEQAASMAGIEADEAFTGPADVAEGQAAALSPAGDALAFAGQTPDDSGPEPTAGEPDPVGATDHPTALTGVERPPEAPAALGDLRGVLSRIVGEGLSEEDVRGLVDGARAALRSAIGRLTESAAGALLAAINKPGVDYELGKVVGSLVSQLLVEAVLAALTAGASAAISAAKAAIQGARATSKLASIIGKVRRFIEPLLEVIKKVRAAVTEIVELVGRWLDDVVAWMRGIGRRIKGRLSRLGRRGAKPTSHGGGGHTQAALTAAMVEAKVVSDTMEGRGFSVAGVLLALQALRFQYRWIKGFRARPRVGRRRHLYLIASEKEFDTYDGSAPAAPKKKRRGRPVASVGEELGEDGLTFAQRAWYRKRIDKLEPHSPAKADRLRFDRHRAGKAQKAGDLDPDAIRRFRGAQSRAENRVSGNRLRANSRRGSAHENAALSDLRVPNNNVNAAPKTFTHDGVTTRPDALTRKALVEVKSTTKPVQYRTTQIRAQQSAGRHVTVITGGPSSAVVPSGPLASPVIVQRPGGSAVILKPRILHRDPATGGWSMWDRTVGGSGAWRPISVAKARKLARF